ncbi:MAG: hypothetical protein PHN88_07530 [Ignavibacteria bacterium]|nr:hypothetical protein [Ignavibacteria bacterium]
MKTQKFFYLLLVLMISIGFTAGCGKKDASKDGKSEDKKESAGDINSPKHLKYEMKGEKESGTLDMYFKGKNAKLEIASKEAQQDMNSVMYIKDGMMYMVIDMAGKKMGMKMDVSKDESFNKEFGKLFDVKDKLKDYTKGSTEEIIGYKCDVYSKGEEKIWVYKDMAALKFTDGKTTMTATAFEPDAKLTETFFDPPKDIEFQSMDDLKNMGK